MAVPPAPSGRPASGSLGQPPVIGGTDLLRTTAGVHIVLSVTGRSGWRSGEGPGAKLTRRCIFDWGSMISSSLVASGDVSSSSFFLASLTMPGVSGVGEIWGGGGGGGGVEGGGGGGGVNGVRVGWGGNHCETESTSASADT